MGDCMAGYNNWRAGWSVTKKDWCCQNLKLGCDDHMLPVARKFDEMSLPAQSQGLPRWALSTSALFGMSVVAGLSITYIKLFKSADGPRASGSYRAVPTSDTAA